MSKKRIKFQIVIWCDDDPGLELGDCEVKNKE